MYTREKYLEIIKRAEARNACEGNLQKAKEFFEAGDFEALHRIVVGNQDWLRGKGIISEPLSGKCESWHDNGKLSFHGTYVDGNNHGAWEWFYDNGKPSTRGTYVNGKRHGDWEWFYSNGKLKLLGTYVTWKNHGVRLYWRRF
jgi:antitoxin component YwqK of YwqJK toxin-antitoxin module